MSEWDGILCHRDAVCSGCSILNHSIVVFYVRWGGILCQIGEISCVECSGILCQSKVVFCVSVEWFSMCVEVVFAQVWNGILCQSKVVLFVSVE